MSLVSQKNLRVVALVSMLVGFSIAFDDTAIAQNKPAGEQPNANQVVAQTATMTASLVDAEKNAKEKSATVEVRVSGVELIDPAMTNKLPVKGQGHLHYQVDNGPIVATTTAKLSFHGLTPGKHKIVVVLANNDHTPAGPTQTLEITVP
jgi:hypothetical protein